AAGLKKAIGIFYKSQKVSIINNGINCRTYAPASEKTTVPGDPIVISMMGRFTYLKDQRTLIEAFSELQSQRPELKLELQLAGTGETLAELEQLVNGKGIANVKFLGMLSEPEVVKFLQQTTIYVHSSKTE